MVSRNCAIALQPGQQEQNFVSKKKKRKLSLKSNFYYLILNSTTYGLNLGQNLNIFLMGKIKIIMVPTTGADGVHHLLLGRLRQKNRLNTGGRVAVSRDPAVAWSRDCAITLCLGHRVRLCLNNNNNNNNGAHLTEL